MTLAELTEKAIALPASERLELVSRIIKSIQQDQSLQQDSHYENWQYLEPRAESWRKQLYIKGRKLPASVVWSDMIANEMTMEQAICNWDLPQAAIEEAIRYYENKRELLAQEAKINREAAPSVRAVAA